MGDGPLMTQFKDEANDLNVIFTGRLEYNKMCGILVECDMVVNLIVGTSVASIINKHADYASSGRPIINTQKSEEYRSLLDKYEMGFNCKNEIELAYRIQMLKNNPTLRFGLGDAARICAEERFDRAKTYRRIVEMIKKGNSNEEKNK